MLLVCTDHRWRRERLDPERTDSNTIWGEFTTLRLLEALDTILCTHGTSAQKSQFLRDSDSDRELAL